MMSIPTIRQPLLALFKQADQVQEFLDLARQKVAFATSQNAFGNGVPMFDTISEALPAIGIVTAAAAVGGYFVYKWINHRRAMNKTAGTT
jgi:hypothetical protein